MNLPKIQALVAPLSAPVPSALGIATEAFNYFRVPDIASWQLVSWAAAIGSFVGIETLGGASCYALVKLHRQRNYGIEFWIAFCGILAYVGSGLYSLAHSPIIIFFFLAPFSYFAYSILRSMESEHIEKVSETEAQTALINAQTRQLNAETRKAKASAMRPKSSDMVQDRQLDAANIARQAKKEALRQQVFDYLNDNPDASYRGVADALGLSKSTVEPYVKEYKALNGSVK